MSRATAARTWLKGWIRRHLIATDPQPTYTRLDQLDGLKGTP